MIPRNRYFHDGLDARTREGITMAVSLRLSRAGAKKAPYYHIVAADSRCARDGAFLEQIGSFHPGTEELRVDDTKLEKWIKNGAQVSVTVKNLLKKRQSAATQA